MATTNGINGDAQIGNKIIAQETRPGRASNERCVFMG